VSTCTVDASPRSIAPYEGSANCTSFISLASMSAEGPICKPSYSGRKAATGDHSQSQPQRGTDVSMERGPTQSGTRLGGLPTVLSLPVYQRAIGSMSCQPVFCTST
jgi:hypothetical protein